MGLNPILVDGFVASVLAERMTIEQTPIPYQDEVRKRVEERKEP